jgi:hypothetical protein
MTEIVNPSFPREVYGGILQDFLQSPPKRFAMGQTLPGLTISSTKNV